MDILTVILGLFALTSLFASLAASFYGVRQTTIIKTLKSSNDAYKENNAILQDQLKSERAEFSKELAELRGKVSTLEKIKTPPLNSLIALVTNNHKEVMNLLEGNK